MILCNLSVTALVMSLKLGEEDLIRHVLESIPSANSKQRIVSFSIAFLLSRFEINIFAFLVELIVRSIPTAYLVRLTKFLSSSLESTRHVELYLIWIENLMNDSRFGKGAPRTVALALHRNLAKKHQNITKVLVNAFLTE